MATKKQQAELNKLLKEWTNILRLNAWDIYAEFGTVDDFATNVKEKNIRDTAEMAKIVAKNRGEKSDIRDLMNDDDLTKVLAVLSQWYPEDSSSSSEDNDNNNEEDINTNEDTDTEDEEEEIIGNVSSGEIQVDYASGTVLILILDPKDYKEQDFFMEQDIEETLVHELLHLFFYDIDGLSPDNISQLYIDEICRGENDKNINRPEKLINDMAKILVKLKRAGKK